MNAIGTLLPSGLLCVTVLFACLEPPWPKVESELEIPTEDKIEYMEVSCYNEHARGNEPDMMHVKIPRDDYERILRFFRNAEEASFRRSDPSIERYSVFFKEKGSLWRRIVVWDWDPQNARIQREFDMDGLRYVVDFKHWDVPTEENIFNIIQDLVEQSSTSFDSIPPQP